MRAGVLWLPAAGSGHPAGQLPAGAIAALPKASRESVANRRLVAHWDMDASVVGFVHASRRLAGEATFFVRFVERLERVPPGKSLSHGPPTQNYSLI